MNIPEHLAKRADDYIDHRLELVDYDKDCVKFWSKIRNIFIEFYSIGATDQLKIDIDNALKVYEELMTCSGYFPETITAELARMRNKLEE